MTREERKQKRQARREAIKQRRLARREARAVRKDLQRMRWDDLATKVKAMPAIEQLEGSVYEERFNEIWPAVRAALQFAISLRITREGLDRALERIVLIGDRMADGQQITDEDSLSFLEKLDRVWGWVRTVLNVAKVFTPNDVDNVIDKIIEVGDWILDQDDED